VTASEFAAMVAGVVRGMPAGHVQALAAAVASAPAHDPGVAAAGVSAIANPLYRQNAQQLLTTWAQADGVTGQAFAVALLAALAMRDAEREAETVEAVATGPSSSHVSLRHTKAVILDLVSHASADLIIVSFSAYKVPEVVSALGEAARRGVNVRLVLETTEDSSGALTHDASRAFAAIGAQVEFYVWPADRRPAGVSATLHAKAVVADSQAAFITSANLTGSALDHNLELGVLIKGGPLPKRLADHFTSLIGSGTLKRVG
jgi:cardiolipin synthase